MFQRHLNIEHEHFDPGDIRSPDRIGISCLAHNPDLGLDTVGQITKTTHYRLRTILDWVHFCHSIGPACHFIPGVRSGSSLSVLRSFATPDI